MIPRAGLSISVGQLLVIMAILATVAYSAYRDSVVKSKRKAAAGCAIEAAQFMERFYTTNMTYQGAALPALGCAVAINDEVPKLVGNLPDVKPTVLVAAVNE